MFRRSKVGKRTCPSRIFQLFVLWISDRIIRCRHIPILYQWSSQKLRLCEKINLTEVAWIYSRNILSYQFMWKGKAGIFEYWSTDVASEVFHLENHLLNDPLVWLLALFVDLNIFYYNIISVISKSICYKTYIICWHDIFGGLPVLMIDRQVKM